MVYTSRKNGKSSSHQGDGSNSWRPPHQRCGEPGYCSWRKISCWDANLIRHLRGGQLTYSFRQWPCNRNQFIGGTDSIYVWPIFLGLWKGISPQNMALYGTVPHFRMLEFPFFPEGITIYQLWLRVPSGPFWIGVGAQSPQWSKTYSRAGFYNCGYFPAEYDGYL